MVQSRYNRDFPNFQDGCRRHLGFWKKSLRRAVNTPSPDWSALPPVEVEQGRFVSGFSDPHILQSCHHINLTEIYLFLYIFNRLGILLCSNDFFLNHKRPHVDIVICIEMARKKSAHRKEKKSYFHVKRVQKNWTKKSFFYKGDGIKNNYKEYLLCQDVIVLWSMCDLLERFHVCLCVLFCDIMCKTKYGTHRFLISINTHFDVQMTICPNNTDQSRQHYQTQHGGPAYGLHTHSRAHSLTQHTRSVSSPLTTCTAACCCWQSPDSQWGGGSERSNI